MRASAWVTGCSASTSRKSRTSTAKRQTVAGSCRRAIRSTCGTRTKATRTWAVGSRRPPRRRVNNVNSIHYEQGCDFCDIARGAAPETERVWEAESWLAFFPLDPATPGHTLNIPRTHVTDLWDVKRPLDEQLIHASIQMGRAIRTALSPDGLNLITS